MFQPPMTPLVAVNAPALDTLNTLFRFILPPLRVSDVAITSPAVLTLKLFE